MHVDVGLWRQNLPKFSPPISWLFRPLSIPLWRISLSRDIYISFNLFRPSLTRKECRNVQRFSGEKFVLVLALLKPDVSLIYCLYLVEDHVIATFCTGGGVADAKNAKLEERKAQFALF